MHRQIIMFLKNGDIIKAEDLLRKHIDVYKNDLV